MALPKNGLLPGKSGDVYLADVGIPKETYLRMGLDSKPPFGRRYCVRLDQRLQ